MERRAFSAARAGALLRAFTIMPARSPVPISTPRACAELALSLGRKSLQFVRPLWMSTPPKARPPRAAAAVADVVPTRAGEQRADRLVGDGLLRDPGGG